MILNWEKNKQLTDADAVKHLHKYLTCTIKHTVWLTNTFPSKDAEKPQDMSDWENNGQGILYRCIYIPYQKNLMGPDSFLDSQGLL